MSFIKYRKHNIKNKGERGHEYFIFCYISNCRYININCITEIIKKSNISSYTNICNILNIKMLTNAQLSYIACGQEVPDDISKLDAQCIAKQLLGGDM